jgi:two-component system, OmpR family, sensor histidine kinase BaeS
VSVLDPVRSVKVKLGLLVVASVGVALVVASIGDAGGVPTWLSVPVTVALALSVTQLLAVGMTSPLREMTAAARRMAAGDHAVRVTATSRDEVGELAAAFNRMAEELAAVDRQRRELVANVSHELRTPLTALNALLENLADGVAEPDPATLRAALAQGERMAGLVGDLLDLSRVDAGKAPLARRPVDVRRLLDAAVAEAGVAGRDVEYDVRVAPADLVAEGDPARLHQLVANLLDNASRHSPAGGVVVVRARAEGDRWLLEVSDQGPGVAPEHRERAFERFGTLSEVSADSGGGGTGLGLAIARWVTDLHRGSISFVDPEPGGSGARVRADLPLVPSPPRTILDEHMPLVEEVAPATVTRPETTVPEPAVPPAPAESAHSGMSRLDPPTGPQPLTEQVFGDFWPERGLPGNVRVLLGALGVGVLGAIVLPDRDLGLGVFVVILAAGGVLLANARHRRDRFTLTCAALCVGLASVVVVRDAEWIAVLCLLAGAGLCAAGLVRGRTVPTFVLAVAAWPLAGLRGLPWLGRTLRLFTGIGNKAALARTILLSVIGLCVFALLFASADALVAEWIGAVVPDLGSDDLALRLFVTLFVGGVVLAGAYLALNPPTVGSGERTHRPVAHRFEWLAPVLVVDAVFVLFLVAQAAVIFGGHDYLERTTGLTYAEYVHQGFGQLTVATALTLLVVWAATRKAPRATPADRAWVRGSLGLLCVATLVVVASALYRMSVYQDAYGFTQLRLLVDVFEGWLGLLVLATMAGGLALRATWLPRFGLLSGVVALLGLAALNPDAWVARQNLDRYEETGQVDWVFLAGLSDDALPVLRDLPDDLEECAIDLSDRHGDEVDDWLEWNLGRARVAGFVDDHEDAWLHRTTCPGQTTS